LSDLKLFRTSGGTAVELIGSAVALEKQLQTFIEQNMRVLFGVRFLASEYSTGTKHRGRIDSLGLYETASRSSSSTSGPARRTSSTKVCFYLDWLLDHRAEFEALVTRTLGAEAVPEVDWSNPRLVCVAGSFDRYDEYAVAQINRTIELVRYRDFGGELLALELLTGTSAPFYDRSDLDKGKKPAPSSDKTVSDSLEVLRLWRSSAAA